MNYSDLTRRDWMKTLGLAGLAAAGLGYLDENEAMADLRVRKDAPAGKPAKGLATPPCCLENGTVFRPVSPIPKITETGVLVVGAAALAVKQNTAARDVDYLALKKLLLEQKVFLG